MMELTPNLTLEGLSLMEKAQTIYQLPIVWIPFSAIFLLMLISFLLLGISIKVNPRKRLISQSNFGYVIVIWLVSAGLFILTIFFPFWWDIIN